MGDQTDNPVLDRPERSPAPEAPVTTSAPVGDLPGNQATLNTLVFGPQLPTPGEELDALRSEVERRQQARTDELSIEPTAARARVPVGALVQVPPVGDDELLFEQILENPDSVTRMGAYAADETRAEYLEDKLDIPVTIELEDHDDRTWYAFSIDGEQIFLSTQLALPLSALDTCARENLHAVTERVAQRVGQVATGAVLIAKYRQVGRPILGQAMAMMSDPADYSEQEAQFQHLVAASFLKAISDIVTNLGPDNAWMRETIEPIQHELEIATPFAKNAFEAVSNFKSQNQPDETYGETYDRLVDENDSGGVGGWFQSSGWRAWRFAGEFFSFGGHSMEKQNAQMLRAGMISYNDYKENQYLNMGRSLAVATVTALTAGEAGPLALEALGLEGAATSAAGVVVAGTAEGATGGFVGAVTNDAYAEVVAHVTDSQGVAAYHEAAVGGPKSWFEGAAVGGMMGAGFAVAGHFMPGEVPEIPNATEGDVVIPREDPIAGEFQAQETLARPDLDPTPGPSVVVDPTMVEPEASAPQSSRFTTDPDFVMAGDQTLADMGGNDRVQVDASGQTKRIWRAYEKQVGESMGLDPNESQNSVQLIQPKQFPGKSRAQRTVRPDYNRAGEYAEYKFRDWDNPANATDLAGSLLKIQTIEAESGVSRGAKINVVSSRQVPLKAQKAVLKEIRTQMRAEGKSFSEIADFQNRIVWFWKRPKPFF